VSFLGDSFAAHRQEDMSDILNGIANLTKSVTGSISTYEIRKLGDKVYVFFSFSLFSHHE
jgi:hypothetical protein